MKRTLATFRSHLAVTRNGTSLETLYRLCGGGQIVTEEIADVFIMLVQLFAIFNPLELVNITKIVWDKLDRLKDNLDKETAKQEGGKDESPEH